MEQQSIELIKQLYDSSGVFGAVAAVIMIAVRLYSSSAKVQAMLPEKYRWSALPGYAKLGIVFMASLLGSALVAVAGGSTWMAALVAAIPVAMSAVFANEVTIAAGSAIDDKAIKKQIVVFKSTGKDPNYEPSPYRKAASVIAPIDWEIINSRIDKAKTEVSGSAGEVK